MRFLPILAPNRLLHRDAQAVNRLTRIANTIIARSLLVSIFLTTTNRSAAADWTDTRVVGPFTCRADFSLAGADGPLQDLESLQKDLVRVLGVSPAKEQIEIYLFHNQATHARYMARYLPKVPYRRALYIKGRGPGRVFAYWSRQFEVDLRHECTHALLHASLSVVPLWLDEGLAQYFEAPANQRDWAHPHLTGVRRTVRWGEITPMESLEKKNDLSEMGRIEYRDSWAWVHFMLNGPAETREELTAYLDDIRAGRPPGILSERIQHRLPEPQHRLSQHFYTRSTPSTQ